MKNTLLGLSFLAFLAASISSCTLATTCSVSKSGFLLNFDTMIKKIAEEELRSNDATWESYDSKFKKFVEECYPSYEEQMTLQEKKEFWYKTFEYTWYRHGIQTMELLFDDHDPFYSHITTETQKVYGEDLSPVVERLLEEVIPEQFGELFNEIGTDLEKLWENGLKEDVEKWGRRKLETIFKEELFKESNK